MSAAYWLGVATLPALAFLIAAVVRIHWWITQALEERYGITFEAKVRRRIKDVYKDISNHTLRNDIWWERSFGPVFAGGWCRKEYQEGGDFGDVATRWIGLGSVHGPCLMVFRKRALQ